MRAHSKLTKSVDVSFYNQSTLEVAQRALRESSKDSKTISMFFCTGKI
jgi:hypothetical protein